MPRARRTRTPLARFTGLVSCGHLVRPHERIVKVPCEDPRDERWVCMECHLTRVRDQLRQEAG
jgi:hypothetical protein